MTAAPDPFADVLIPRDQYDRPYIAPPGGGKPEPYTRVSTFCSALSDSSGIGKWKARHVALGVGRYEDLAAMAAGLSYERDKAQLDEIIEAAIDRVGCNAKANWGTAVHTFTDPERDPFDFVPQRMQDDVKAYRELLDACGIEVVSTERFVVNDEIKAAGTYDHVYRVPRKLLPEGDSFTGKPHVDVMGDKKTGTLHFHEHALQLAIYARAKHYDPSTGEREPLGVSTQWALLAHIPAGKAKPVLYWVDIAAGWEAALLALKVREYRKGDGLSSILTPPAMAPKPDLKVVEAAKVVCGKGGCVLLAGHDSDCMPPKAKRGTARGLPAIPTTETEQVRYVENAPLVDKAAAELIKSELNGRELTPEERLTESLKIAVSITALETLWRTRKAIWTEKHTAIAAERRALIEAGKA